jgi:ADP-ribosylglycohydrolase
MRVAPVGALHWNDLDALRRVAREQSLMTHGHPTALAASVACAYVVALALQRVPLPDLVGLSLTYVASEPGCEEVVSILERVEHVRTSDPLSASEVLGSGWIAEEALAIALWAFVRRPGDPIGVIRRAVNFPGRDGSCDRDSVGAIAGAFAGAYNGLSALPAGWVRRLENRALLLQIGSQLAETGGTCVDGR